MSPIAEVGRTFVSVVPVAKGFGRSLDSQVGKDVDSSGKRTGKRFGTALKVGALAVLAGGAIAAKFLGGAVQGASDLAEAQSKVGVVFGKSAGQIITASKTSATAMGISKGAYLDAAGSLGNLLVSLDIAPKAAAGMSQQMVKLAADMASFNNVPVEDALLAIRSGLTGETEPLKRFGVNMNETTLKAQALRMGLIKTTKEALTPQQKALAAQALIMKQTGTAQGDFARTSGGLANQQKILSAQFKDMKDTLGAALLPIITRFVTFLNTSVLPAVKGFITGMQSGTGAGGRFAAIMQGVGTVVQAVGRFIAGTIVPFVQKLGATLVKAAGGADGAKKSLNDIKPVGIVLKAILQALFKAILFALPILIKYWQLLAKGLGVVAKAAIFLWNGAFAPALRFITRGIGILMATWAKMLRALSKVPGFGWAKNAANAMQGASNKALGLSRDIRNIPDRKDTKVNMDTRAARVEAANFNRTIDFVTRPRTINVSVRAGKAAFNAGAGLLPRAHGGPVNPRGTYIVGEHGPEIFTTRQRGQIIPNHKVAGGSSGGNTFNIHNAEDPIRTGREVARQLAFAG